MVPPADATVHDDVVTWSYDCGAEVLKEGLVAAALRGGTIVEWHRSPSAVGCRRYDKRSHRIAFGKEPARCNGQILRPINTRRHNVRGDERGREAAAHETRRGRGEHDSATSGGDAPHPLPSGGDVCCDVPSDAGEPCARGWVLEIHHVAAPRVAQKCHRG